MTRRILFMFFIGAGNFLNAELHQQYHAYMWARYNQAQSNHQVAYDSYQFLLKQNPSPHIYPSFIEYLFDAGQYTAILQLAPMIKNLFPVSTKTKLIFVHALRALGFSVEALKQIDLLVAEAPTDPEVIYLASQLYLQANDFQKSLGLIENFLPLCASRDSSVLFHFLRAQVFMLMKKYGPAKESLRIALDIHPAFDRALLLLGLVHELEGNSIEALQNYENFLTTVGPHPLVVEQIRRLRQQAK